MEEPKYNSAPISDAMELVANTIGGLLLMIWYWGWRLGLLILALWGLKWIWVSLPV